MEFLIIVGLILVGGFGVAYWLNLTNEWAERDKWRRFHDAMRAAQDDDERYLDADDRRPE